MTPTAELIAGLRESAKEHNCDMGELIEISSSYALKLADLLEQQAARIKELEDCIRMVRDGMTSRAIVNFDYDSGEYPINGDTITMLCLDLKEKRDRIAKLEQRVAELQAWIREKEWDHLKPTYPIMGFTPSCGLCGAKKSDGHEFSCQFIKLLSPLSVDAEGGS